MNISYIAINKFSDNSRKAYARIYDRHNIDVVYNLDLSLKQAKAMIKRFNLLEEVSHYSGIESRIYSKQKAL